MGEKPAGQQYYESICWKAINQSIGRAIRHQNDYASILLVDSRYTNQPMSAMKEKLPQWIGDSFRQESSTFNHESIVKTLNEVRCFYLTIYLNHCRKSDNNLC